MGQETNFFVKLLKQMIVAVLILSLSVTPVLALDEDAATVEAETQQDTEETKAVESEEETRQSSQEETISISPGETENVKKILEMSDQNSQKKDVESRSEVTAGAAAADMDDPEFNKYYTIDAKGNIVEKKTDLPRVGIGSGYRHPSKYQDYTVYNCIDVSAWQGNINWTNVKKAGITHAIIRVGYRGQSTGSLNADSYYAKNIENAAKAGIKVGVYFYSQAITESEAVAEAKYTLNLISSYKSKITMPVVFDYEFGLSKKDGGRFYAGRLTKTKMTNICIAFCEKVKSAGYEPMTYANANMLVNYLDRNKLSSKYKIWLAHYTTSTDYSGKFYMWQYSSGGKVSGISGSVDMNFIYEPGKWKKNAAGQYMFLKADGTYAKSEWINYGGKKYYINKNGVRLTGFQTIGSTKYYFTSGGVAQSNKWVTVSGKKYYLLTNGKLAIGYRKIGSYYYGFNASGVMQKGLVTLNGKKYRFMSNGRAYLYTAKIKTKLNYRTGPSTKYKRKGSYKKNKVVGIIRQKNGWGQMTNGYWIKLSYTSKVTKYPRTIFKAYKVKLKTTVNYRTGPGTKYKKKGTYKKGKIVTIKAIKNGWGKMSNGYWIKLSYTKRVS